MKKKTNIRKSETVESGLKTLVATISAEQLKWLQSSSKVGGMKISPFLRTVIGYLMETNPEALLNRIREAKLKTELEAATKLAEEATRVKEEKEKELAALSI